MINDNSKPLIFLGSNSAMAKQFDICDLTGIKIAGIIDSDYWGNTDELHGVKVIDGFNNVGKYRDDYNFFIGSNWIPVQEAVHIRNAEKRKMIMNLVEDQKLSMISLVHPDATISPRSTIGKGCYVDAGVVIEPNCVIGNYNHFYALCFIGHNMTIGNNCVIQRQCMVAHDAIMEDDCYFGLMSKAVKTKCVWRKGTFVQEGIYIKRGTSENEIVTADSKPRVRSMRS